MCLNGQLYYDCVLLFEQQAEFVETGTQPIVSNLNSPWTYLPIGPIWRAKIRPDCCSPYTNKRSIVAQRSVVPGESPACHPTRTLLTSRASFRPPALHNTYQNQQ